MTDYTTLITSEHASKPKFITLVGALTGAIDSMTQVVQSMPSLFDVDNAIGAQQDIVGLWVGVSRVLGEVLLPGFFGFSDDPVALPFGELNNPSIGGRFYEQGEDFSGSTILNDVEYRTVLQAKIIKNQYDGTVGQIEQAMQDVFGVPATVQDPGDGSMSIDLTVQGTVTQTQQALVEQFDLLPRPGGVAIGAISYLTSLGAPSLVADVESAVQINLYPAYTTPSLVASIAFQSSTVSANGPWTPLGSITDLNGFLLVNDLAPGTTYWFQDQIVTNETPPRISPWSVSVMQTTRILNLLAPTLSAQTLGSTVVLTPHYTPSSIVATSVFQMSTVSANGPWTVAGSGASLANVSVTGLASGTYWFQDQITTNETTPRISPWSASLSLTVAATSSADGTTIPSALQIVDSASNVWTLTAGVIYKNGTAAGTSFDVILLLWYGSSIYQENSSDQWFQWNGTAWVSVAADPRISASGTTIPSAAVITDAASNIWTLGPATAGPGQAVYRNSALAGVSYNVILLLWYSGNIYQENSSDEWFQWSGTTWNGVSGDPRVAPPPGTFGIKNTNGVLTNLQGVKMPLYVVCVSGLETMHGGGSRVAGFPAATEAQWAQALTSWGPSKGRNIMAQPTALRFQLISSYWNGDTGTDGPLTDSSGWYSGGKPLLSTAVYQAAVIQTISRATAAGWICVLSLCIDSITEPNGTVHLGLGQPCAPGPTAVKFWATVAAAFKNNPAVILEIFNEAILSNQFSGSGAYGWYAGGGNAANNQPYGGPTLPGPDAIAYLNATSASTVFGPGPAGGCTMMNNSANSSSLQFCSSQMKLAGIKEILSTIAGAGAPNLVAIGVPGFAGGLDDWLGLGITDPRGNNQIAAAYHAYGQGHVQSMRALQAAGIPMIMTEADGGDFAASGFTFKEIFDAGLGYSAGSNGWNNWGAGPNIMTGGASPLTTAPENQGMPVPNGSN